MNKGQLSVTIRDQFLLDAKSICKVQGLPFNVDEIKDVVLKELGQ